MMYIQLLQDAPVYTQKNAFAEQETSGS